MKISESILIIVSTLLFILSDSLSAQWGKMGGRYILFGIVIVAPLGYIFFGILNRHRSLASSSGIVNMGLLIGTVLMSYFFFKEPLNIRESIGILFAIVAIFLLA